MRALILSSLDAMRAPHDLASRRVLVGPLMGSRQPTICPDGACLPAPPAAACASRRVLVGPLMASSLDPISPDETHVHIGAPFLMMEVDAISTFFSLP